jgi:hypothetical protein
MLTELRTIGQQQPALLWPLWALAQDFVSPGLRLQISDPHLHSVDGDGGREVNSAQTQQHQKPFLNLPLLVLSQFCIRVTYDILVQ